MGREKNFVFRNRLFCTLLSQFSQQLPCDCTLPNMSPVDLKKGRRRILTLVNIPGPYYKPIFLIFVLIAKPFNCL